MKKFEYQSSICFLPILELGKNVPKCLLISALKSTSRTGDHCRVECSLQVVQSEKVTYTQKLMANDMRPQTSLQVLSLCSEAKMAKKLQHIFDRIKDYDGIGTRPKKKSDLAARSMPVDCVEDQSFLSEILTLRNVL